MTTTDAYVRRAIVNRVLDGDTVILDVDLGFYIYVRMSCRLAGINARESHTAGGPEATAYLESLLPKGAAVTVQSVKPDKYAGRFDGVVINVNGDNVNDRMVSVGYALPWDGKGPAPIPPWPIAF